MQALQLQDHIKSCYGDVLPALQLLSDTYSMQQQPSSVLDVSTLTVPAPLAAAATRGRSCGSWTAWSHPGGTAS